MSANGPSVGALVGTAFRLLPGPAKEPTAADHHHHLLLPPSDPPLLAADAAEDSTAFRGKFLAPLVKGQQQQPGPQAVSIPTGAAAKPRSPNLWGSSVTQQSLPPPARPRKPPPMSDLLDILTSHDGCHSKAPAARAGERLPRSDSLGGPLQGRAESISCAPPQEPPQGEAQPEAGVSTRGIQSLFAQQRGQQRQELLHAEQRRNSLSEASRRHRHSKAEEKNVTNKTVALCLRDKLLPRPMFSNWAQRGAGRATRGDSPRRSPKGHHHPMAAGVPGVKHSPDNGTASPRTQMRWLDRLNKAELLHRTGQGDDSAQPLQQQACRAVCRRNNHYNNYYVALADAQGEGVAVCRRRFFAFVEPDKAAPPGSAHCDPRYGAPVNNGLRQGRGGDDLGSAGGSYRVDAYGTYLYRRARVYFVVNPSIVAALAVVASSLCGVQGGVVCRLRVAQAPMWDRSAAEAKPKPLAVLEDTLEQRQQLARQGLQPDPHVTGAERLLSLALPPAYIDPLPDDAFSGRNLCCSGLFNRKEALLLERLFERR